MPDSSSPSVTVSPATKLAIVGPSFFSYIQAIADEFRARGIDTSAYDERHSNKVVDKILYRLGVYQGRLSPKKKHLAGVLGNILMTGCTDVLLVDTEVVDRKFVSDLAQAGLRVHLYMWDGEANKPRFKSYLDILDSKASFDPHDCKTLEMTYIPLFATVEFDEDRLERGPYDYDISFCGTVHSSRAAIISKMLKADWAKGLSLGLMLYYHSRALYSLKSIFDRGAWALRNRITSVPYPKSRIARMFSKSRYVLDVAHPGQSGITARTFEVLMSGSRLLTFNSVAAEVLPNSLLPRIRVINDIDEAAVIDFNSSERLPKLSQEERYFLSLERFIDQLITMMWADVPSVTPANSQWRVVSVRTSI